MKMSLVYFSPMAAATRSAIWGRFAAHAVELLAGDLHLDDRLGGVALDAPGGARAQPQVHLPIDDDEPHRRPADGIRSCR